MCPHNDTTTTASDPPVPMNNHDHHPNPPCDSTHDEETYPSLEPPPPLHDDREQVSPRHHHRRHHSHGDHHHHPNSHSHRSLLAEAAMTAAAAVEHHNALDIHEHLQQLLIVVPRPISTSTTCTIPTSSTTATFTSPISSRILHVEDDSDRNDGIHRNPNDQLIDENHHDCIETTIVTAQSPTLTTDEGKDATNKVETSNLSCLGRMMEYIKYIYSTLLLLFSIVVVMYAIFSQQTVATAATTTTTASDNSSNSSTTLNVYIAALCFWICIVWLAIMEGTQSAVVGLQSVRPNSYQASHPRTFQNTQLIYRHTTNTNSQSTVEENTGATDTSTNSNHKRLERFIVGRQFLVVLVVFILNTLSTAIPGAALFVDEPEETTKFMSLITTIFLDNGVAAILITIIVGQLIAQIVSSNCMLDFMNNYLVYGTEQISLLIESSGLLHAVYLFQLWFTRTSTKSKRRHKHGHTDDADPNNVATDHIAVSQHAAGSSCLSIASSSASVSTVPPPTRLSQTLVILVPKAFFWCRVLLSISILVFSFAVTISALVQNQTKMWDGVPVPISIILLIVLMMVVGMLEGLQIALFAVIRRTDLEVQYPMAHQNSQLILWKSQNLPAFLIGRQILVTGCTFIVARITAVDVDTATGSNIFGVGDNLQSFFNTGLLGAIVTTIMASLIWRIIAASYPIAFLSNPVVYFLIRLCLSIETSGICSSAWILAYLHKKVMNYKNDKMYIGMNHQPTDDDALAVDELNSKHGNGKISLNDLDLEQNASPTPQQQ